jgi:pilus assembly protein FimV
MAIGDEEGARALIEEVIAESSGDMKTKAQRALNSLS